MAVFEGVTQPGRTLILVGLEKGIQHSVNDDEPTIYAARFRNLGLTAYGDSSEEAEHNLQVSLETFANKLFRKGILEQRFALLNIRWYWEDTPGWVTLESGESGVNNQTERLLLTA